MSMELHDDDLTEDIFASTSHQSPRSFKFSPRKWASSVGVSPAKRKIGGGNTTHVEESSVDIYGDLSTDSKHVEVDETDNRQMVEKESEVETNMDQLTDVIISDMSVREELEGRIKELEDLNNKLLTQNQSLLKCKEQLSKNISSLFLTAKLELQRKDKETQALRKEIQDLKTQQTQQNHEKDVCLQENSTALRQEAHEASNTLQFPSRSREFGDSNQRCTSSPQSTENYSAFDQFRNGLKSRGSRERDKSSKRCPDKQSGRGRDRIVVEERRDRSENRRVSGFERDSKTELIGQRDTSTLDSKREAKRKSERDRDRSPIDSKRDSKLDRERDKCSTESKRTADRRRDRHHIESKKNSGRERNRSPIMSGREPLEKNSERERNRSPIRGNRDSETKSSKEKSESLVKSKRDSQRRSDTGRGRSPGERKDHNSRHVAHSLETSSQLDPVSQKSSCTPPTSDQLSCSARRGSKSSNRDDCNEYNYSGDQRDVAISRKSKTQVNLHKDRDRNRSSESEGAMDKRCQTGVKTSESVFDERRPAEKNDLRAKLLLKRRPVGAKSKGAAPSQDTSGSRGDGGQVRKDQPQSGKTDIESRPTTSSSNNNAPGNGKKTDEEPYVDIDDDMQEKDIIKGASRNGGPLVKKKKLPPDNATKSRHTIQGNEVRQSDDSTKEKAPMGEAVCNKHVADCSQNNSNAIFLDDRDAALKDNHEKQRGADKTGKEPHLKGRVAMKEREPDKRLGVDDGKGGRSSLDLCAEDKESTKSNDILGIPKDGTCETMKEHREDAKAVGAKISVASMGTQARRSRDESLKSSVGESLKSSVDESLKSSVDESLKSSVDENPGSDTAQQETKEKKESSLFFFLAEGGKVRVRKKSIETNKTCAESKPIQSVMMPLKGNEEECRETDTSREKKKSISDNSDFMKEKGNREVLDALLSTPETEEQASANLNKRDKSDVTGSRETPVFCDSQPRKMIVNCLPIDKGQTSKTERQTNSNSIVLDKSSDGGHASKMSSDALCHKGTGREVSTSPGTNFSSRVHFQAEDCFSSYKRGESCNNTRVDVEHEDSDHRSQGNCQRSDSNSIINPRMSLSMALTSVALSNQDLSSLTSNASLPFSNLMENTNNSCSSQKARSFPQNPSPVSLSNHTWPFKAVDPSQGVVHSKTKPGLSFTLSSSSSSSSSSASSSSSLMCIPSDVCKSVTMPSEINVPSKASHSEGARAFPITELQSDQPNFPPPPEIMLTTPSATHPNTSELLKTSLICGESSSEKTSNSQGTVGSFGASFETNSHPGNDTDTNGVSIDCQESDTYQSVMSERDLADEANLTPPKIRKKKLSIASSAHSPSLFSPISRKSTTIMCTPNLIVLGDEEATSGTLISPCKPQHVPSDLYPPGVRMNPQEVDTHRHIRGEPELLHPAMNRTAGQSVCSKTRREGGKFNFHMARSALFTDGKNSDDMKGLSDLSESTSYETVESSTGERESGSRGDEREEVSTDERFSQKRESKRDSTETETSVTDIGLECEGSMLSAVREAFVKVFKKNLSTFKSDMTEKAANDHRLLKATLRRSVGNILRHKSPLRATGRFGKVHRRRRRRASGTSESETTKSQNLHRAKDLLVRKKPPYIKTTKPRIDIHENFGKESEENIGHITENVDNFAQNSVTAELSAQELRHDSETVATEHASNNCSKCHQSLPCICSGSCLETSASSKNTTMDTSFASVQQSPCEYSQSRTKRSGFRFYLLPGVREKGGKPPPSKRRHDLDNNSSSSMVAQEEKTQSSRNSEDRLINDIVSSLDMNWQEAIEKDFTEKVDLLNPKLSFATVLSQEHHVPQDGTCSEDISFAGKIPSSLDSAIADDDKVIVQERDLCNLRSSCVSLSATGQTESEMRKQKLSFHGKRLLNRGQSFEAACCASPDTCLVTSSDIHRDASETGLGSTRTSPFGTEEPNSTSEPFPQYPPKASRPHPRQGGINREAQVTANHSSTRCAPLPQNESAHVYNFEREQNRHDLPDSPQREPRMRGTVEILNTPKSSKRKTFQRKSSRGCPRGSLTSLQNRLFPEDDIPETETREDLAMRDEKSMHDMKRVPHSLLKVKGSAPNNDENFSQLQENNKEITNPLPLPGTSHETKDCLNTTFIVNTDSSDEEDEAILASAIHKAQERNLQRSCSHVSPSRSTGECSPLFAMKKRRVPPSPLAMDELSLDARSLSEFDQDLFRTRQMMFLPASSRTASISSLLSVGHDSPMSVSSHRFSTPASHRSPRDALLSPPDFKALDSCDEGHGDVFEGDADNLSCGRSHQQHNSEHCDANQTVLDSKVMKLSRHWSFQELRSLMLVKSRASPMEEGDDSCSEEDELSLSTPMSQSAQTLSATVYPASCKKAKPSPVQHAGHKLGETEESSSDEESGQLSDDLSSKISNRRSLNNKANNNSRALDMTRSMKKKVMTKAGTESSNQEREDQQRQPVVCEPSRNDRLKVFSQPSNSSQSRRDLQVQPLSSEKDVGEDCQGFSDAQKLSLNDPAQLKPKQTPRKFVRIAELVPMESITAGSPPLNEEDNFILKRLNPSPLRSSSITKQSLLSRDGPRSSRDGLSQKNSREPVTKPQDSRGASAHGRKNQEGGASDGQQKARRRKPEVDREVLSWAVAHRKNVDKVKMRLDTRLSESELQNDVSIKETDFSGTFDNGRVTAHICVEKDKSEDDRNKSLQGRISKDGKKMEEEFVESVITAGHLSEDFEDGQILDNTDDDEDGGVFLGSDDGNSNSNRGSIDLENTEPEIGSKINETQSRDNFKLSSKGDTSAGRSKNESLHPNVRDKSKAVPPTKPKKRMPNRRSKNFASKSNSGHRVSLLDQAHGLSPSRRSGHHSQFNDDNDPDSRNRIRNRKRPRSPSPHDRSRSRHKPSLSKARREIVNQREFRRSISAEIEEDVDGRGGRKQGSELKCYANRDSDIGTDVRRRDRYEYDGRNSAERKNVQHRPERLKDIERLTENAENRGRLENRRLSPLRNHMRKSRSGSNTRREEGRSHRDWSSDDRYRD